MTRTQWFLIAATAALFLLLMLTGCGTPEGGWSDDEGQPSDIPGTSVYLKEVTVNGKDCIVFRDGSVGGISCVSP